MTVSQGSTAFILDLFILLSVSKYGKRIFIDVLEMKESDVVVHSKDQDIQDWSNIALQIKEYYENYHGFVILHGTDTMAYLASALSFMFENLGKSVIFTGSQVSLEISIETRKPDFCEKHIKANKLADVMCSMLFDASTIQL